MRQRGGPGRPLVLWAARRFGGMTLREVWQMAGGMDYTTVSMAVNRFEQCASKDQRYLALMQQVTEIYEK